MTRELHISRSGHPSVLINGISLHSRYDPIKEADRRARLVAPGGHVRCIVVVGEGLPYLSRVLADRFPDKRILSVMLTAPPHSAPPPGEWTAADIAEEGAIRGWLRSRVHPLDAAALAVERWEPAARCAPTAIERIESEVVAAIRDLQGQIATVGSFGLRWLSNAIRTVIDIDTRWEVRVEGGPLLLATSGPSLERLSRFLRQGAAAPLLFATSSALRPVTAAGLTPALIVHTDGGFWARRYLARPPRTAFGTATTADSPLLALPPRSGGVRLGGSAPRFRPALLATGWVGDELAPDSSEWTVLPEMPSVASSMLALARVVAPDSALLISGLDLCSRGISTHARPHANDSVVSTASHRLISEESLRFRRAVPRGGGRAERDYTWPDGVPAYQSAALEAFVEPTRRLIAEHRRRAPVCHIEPSPVWEESSRCLDGEPKREGAHLVVRRIERPPKRRRIAHLRTVLDAWMHLSPTDESVRTRDILLHAAPVEMVRFARGASTSEEVSRASGTAIAKLRRLVEHLDG